MKTIFRTFAPLRLCGSIFLLFFLSSCAALPPEFFTKDKNFSLYGLYNVSPTTGVSGLGVVTYESARSQNDPRIDELEKTVELLRRALLALVAELRGGEPDKPKQGGAVLKNFLAGKKTYIASAALAAYAALGFLTGQIEAGKAFELLTESGAIAALRAALAR